LAAHTPRKRSPCHLGKGQKTKTFSLWELSSRTLVPEEGTGEILKPPRTPQEKSGGQGKKKERRGSICVPKKEPAIGMLNRSEGESEKQGEAGAWVLF